MMNIDKIFKAVIEEESLIKYGEYNPNEYESVYDAVDDDNIVISTVARIIAYYQSNNHSDKEIYKEITNYLKNNMI